MIKQQQQQQQQLVATQQHDNAARWIRRKDSTASTATTVSISSTASFRNALYEGEEEVEEAKDFATTTTRTEQLQLQLSFLLAGTLAGLVVAVFATYFPFWIDITPNQHASTTIYQHAGYSYDPLKSRFDNTFLTYGTDYGLALAMMVSAYAIAVKKKTSSSSCNNNNNNNKKNDSFSSSSSSSQQQQQQQQQQLVLLQQQHIFYSRAMLLTYMLSVLAGGIAHQYFTTLQSRNHTAGAFRFLWTVCVGSVTAASGFMGSIGAVWARYDGQQEQRRRRVVVVVLNEQFWMAYAVVVTAVVVAGGWSYQRPAADIFVAGITQFPSTFYIMYLLYTGLPTLRLSKAWRYAGLVAFIANAPLLPAYPLLCVYATQHLSLGQVNLILHSNLLLAWCGQGRVLRAVTAAWEVSWGIPPPAAVPVKKLCKAY